MVDVEAVGTILRDLSQGIALPRFNRLAAADVQEKAPGDLVTVVDWEMENALRSRLGVVLPGARFIGEEACAADPSILESIDRGDVWLVDPLDGTRNFAAGSSDFAVMVALLRDGEPLASWIYAPVSDRLCLAELGSGALVDGERARVRVDGDTRPPYVVGRYMPEPLRSSVVSALGEANGVEGTGAAAFEYPDLVAGRWSALLYWRTQPWDHVPGTLFLQEAGGYSARLDGSPYRASVGMWGLLAAPNFEMWQSARMRLPANVAEAYVG